MFLSVTTSTLVLIALANSAVAVPVSPHATLSKRASGVTISHNGLCLGIESPKDGARLSEKDCKSFGVDSNPPFYNRWDIVPGNNDGLKLSGSNFVLGSGDLTGSYEQDLAKIWTQFKGIAAQQYVLEMLIGNMTWLTSLFRFAGSTTLTTVSSFQPLCRHWLTYDFTAEHIAVTGGKDCLESGPHGIIYTQCASTVEGGTQSFDVSDWVIADPTQVTSAPPTQTTPPLPPPITQGKPIKWRMNGQDKCLTVAGAGDLQNGAAINMYVHSSPFESRYLLLYHSADCVPSASAFYPLQQFVYTQGATQIRVAPNTLTKTDFCVDFGSDRGVNGANVKVGLRCAAAALLQR